MLRPFVLSRRAAYDAGMAANLAYTDPRLLTVAEFLDIQFPDGVKAELERGVIRLMGGGSTGHARVQMNLYGFLRAALRGSGCRPYGSDAGVETVDLTIRYPDLTIACGPQLTEDRKALVDPRVIMEVLSPSTRLLDEGPKLAEYQRLSSVDTVVLVDPVAERVRVVQRMGPDEWHDRRYAEPADVSLPALGITIPHAEMFALD